MSKKQTRRKFDKSFKDEAVALVTEQSYSVPQAVESLGIYRSIYFIVGRKI